jgi:hypothetical protein
LELLNDEKADHFPLPSGIAALKAYDQMYAAVLKTEAENDIRMIQTVKVKGDTVYRFSGFEQPISSDEL